MLKLLRASGQTCYRTGGIETDAACRLTDENGVCNTRIYDIVIVLN